MLSNSNKLSLVHGAGVRNPELHVLHITESHAKKDGGVTTVVNDLTYHIGKLGIISYVLAATDKNEYTPSGVGFVKLGYRCNTMSALFSAKLKADVRLLIESKNINVIHIHGVWMPLQIIAARLAKEMNIPFLITSHGMYEPWLWTGKGWKVFVKKKLYFNTVAYPAFKHASSIHGITPQESENLKNLFPKQSQSIIPNAIDIKDSVPNTSREVTQTIFYIGRMNPKKGVDLLLKAFDVAKLSKDWKLVLAGPEEVPEYVEELRSFVDEHGLADRVSFSGVVYGEEKEAWYKRAWVTVVPSFSEVVGMVNLEASLYSCPTITTHQCGLSDWEEGGGVLVEPTVASLTAALITCSQWTGNERKERGLASYDLVQEKYAWRTVSKQWKAVYENMLEEV